MNLPINQYFLNKIRIANTSSAHFYSIFNSILYLCIHSTFITCKTCKYLFLYRVLTTFEKKKKTIKAQDSSEARGLQGTKRKRMCLKAVCKTTITIRQVIY